MADDLSYGPDEATCRVFTFRDGVLSKLGHDLEIVVEAFEIRIDEGRTRVEATFSADSLRVVGATGGDAQIGGLSKRDKRTIEKTIRKEILEADAHPEIRFVATGVDPSASTLEGDVTIKGKTNQVTVAWAAKRGQIVGTSELDQTRWGIKPYTAFLGALKLKPTVRVEVELPKEAIDG